MGKTEHAALRLYRPTKPQMEFLRDRSHVKMLRGANQVGKGGLKTEIIHTPNGPKLLGDIVTGDVVLGGDGRPCNVIGVYPQPKQPVYRITFCDGSSIVCDGPHRWKVMTPNARFRTGKWSVMSTNDIMDQFGNNPKPTRRCAIPRTPEWDGPRAVDLDPYVLGVLLGDGGLSTGSVTVTTSDQYIIDRISAAGFRTRHTDRYTHRVYGVQPIVRRLGLDGKRSWEKSIPELYMYATHAQRMELLRGLMDTDGTCGRDNGCPEFCTTSEVMANQVARLFRSLGGKCKVSSRQTYKGEKRPGRVSYRVRPRCDFNPFSLPRKAELFRAPESTCSERLIYSIEPAGEAETVCIAVDSPDHTFIWGEDYIVTHNTYAGAYECLARMLGTHPEYGDLGPQKILCVTHSWKLSIAIMNKVRELTPMDQLDENTSYTDKNGFSGHYLGLKNGSSMRFITSQQDMMSLASMTVDCVWWDELPLEHQWSELMKRTARKARPGRCPSAIITATPINAPVLWVKKKVQLGEISETVIPLTVENCTPIGGLPFVTEEGIKQEIADCLPIERGQRIEAAWEGIAVDQYLTGFSLDVLSKEPPGDDQRIWVGVGIDHGAKAGRQAAALLLYQVNPLDGRVRKWCWDEEISGDRTSSGEDAAAVLAMLERNNIDPFEVDYVVGDVQHGGDRIGSRKNNNDLKRAWVDILGVANVNKLPPAFRDISTPKKNDKSVRHGFTALNKAMISGDLLIHPRCAKIQDGCRYWKGDPKDPRKDPLDALRYIHELVTRVTTPR